MIKAIKMLRNREMLFCDIGPTCYAISLEKEICKRHMQDFMENKKFAKTIENEKLPNIVSNHSSNIIKRAPGVDLSTQENKMINIMLACDRMHGIVIKPNEEFSFWKLIGRATKKSGFKEGRVLHRNKLTTGIGGGLCNLANTIHLLVLHSPLELTELHTHSDALAPDEGERKPFSAGTSVVYNNRDYRFKNNTEQSVQLLLWVEDEKLYAELRSEREFPWSYELIEENHHFKQENDKYYRISQIYKQTKNKFSEDLLSKELILDNKSEVMFDYNLIPKEQIKQ